VALLQAILCVIGRNVHIVLRYKWELKNVHQVYYGIDVLIEITSKYYGSVLIIENGLVSEGLELLNADLFVVTGDAPIEMEVYKVHDSLGCFVSEAIDDRELG
jgi:hypothetical protein